MPIDIPDITATSIADVYNANDMMGTLRKVVELRKQLPTITKLKAKGTAFCIEIGTAGRGVSTVNLQVAVEQMVDGAREVMDQV